MNWGICGWSTLAEYTFFKQQGKDYDIDLLIIGWVDNDPDVAKIPLVYLEDPALRYPLLCRVSKPMAEMLNTISNSYAYDKWIEKIYSAQNLKDYEQVLKDFHLYLSQNNIASIVVMTPDSPFRPRTKRHFDQAEPLIRQAGFPCLNLYAPVKSQLNQYTEEQLRANPSNDHPGDLMTEVFAREVKAYLVQNKYLPEGYKR
jgi:hypothetical protein